MSTNTANFGTRWYWPVRIFSRNGTLPLSHQKSGQDRRLLRIGGHTAQGRPWRLVAAHLPSGLVSMAATAMCPTQLTQ